MALTKVTYAMIDGAPINVLDFNADPTGLTDSTTAIQNAVDAADAQNGGIVFFPIGTYLTQEIVLPANVLIEGNGSTIKAAVGENYIFRLLGDNITIQNCNFDGTNLTDVNTNPLDGGLKSCVIYIRVGTGAFKNIRVLNNQFLNIPTTSGDYHAMGSSEASCYVDGNYVEQCGGDVFNFNVSGYSFVTNNSINNSGDGGVAFNNGARGSISNNYIYKCMLGIGCGPEGSQTDPFEDYSLNITNNTIDSCQFGINMGWFSFAGSVGPANWLIDGNTFYRCKNVGVQYDGHSGLFVANGVISNNVFFRTGDIAYDGTAATDSYDIGLNNCGNVVVSNNNMRDPQGTTSRTGIFINSCNKMLVEGNIVFGPANSYSTGINVFDSNGSKIESNIISDVAFGVQLQGSGTGNNISVSFNRINNFTSAGIRVLNATNQAVVSNNILETSVISTGISLSASILNTTANYNTFFMPATSTAVIVNTSLVSNFYQVSYNTVFGLTITDGGPGGATKNITGNW